MDGDSTNGGLGQQRSDYIGCEMAKDRRCYTSGIKHATCSCSTLVSTTNPQITPQKIKGCFFGGGKGQSHFTPLI